MPASPLGVVQVVLVVAAIALIIFLNRIYSGTEVPVVKYGVGVIMFGLSGIVGSYILALIITPMFSTAPDYRFKFWGTFIGLSLIAIIAGGLISLIYTRKIEDKESGENNEGE